MKCGHPESDSNIIYYKKTDGYTRKVCRTCKRETNKLRYLCVSPERKRLSSMPVDKDAPRRFEVALTEASNDSNKPQPKCLTPVGETSAWIDWATDEDMREEGEGPAPTHQQARLMCDNCPLLDLCTSAALAKRPYHGVRGSGLIFELGKRI